MTTVDRTGDAGRERSRRALRALTGEGARTDVGPGGSLLGRDRELVQLETAIVAAGERRGSVIVISGDAGIGKTRLAEEAMRRAAGEGAFALRARCWEAGGAPSYWPWLQIVQGLGNAADSLRVDAERLQNKLQPAGRDSTPRFDLLDELVSFVRLVSAQATVVLVIDDLHAADESSLAALQLLAAHVADQAILVVATYRTMEARERPTVARAITELVRAGHEMVLDGLDVDAVEHIVAGRAGVTPTRQMAERIRHVTAGNPFFVDQVARLIRTDELTDGTATTIPIPEQVRDAVRWRLKPLSSQLLQMLDIAAVAGREFELSVVSELGRVPLADLVGMLDDAVTAGLVAPAGTSFRFEFTHSLVRETLYEDQRPAQRMRTHRMAAELFERRVIDGDQTLLSEVAHHYVAAAPLCDIDRAVSACRQAAQRARQVNAHGDAAALFGHAVELITGQGAAPRARCRALLDLGDAQHRAGDAAAARQTFTAAAAAAEAASWPEGFARAALGYGGGLGGYGFADRADQDLIDLLQRALGQLDDGDSVLRVRLLARLAVELYYTPLATERDAYSGDALAMAERLDDAEALLVARYSRLWSRFGPDEIEARRAVADELVALAIHVGDHDLALRGHHLRLVTALELGDVVDVDETLRRYARLVEQLRQPVHRWHLLVLQAMRAFIGGHLDEAERHTFEALELGRGAQGDAAALLFGVQLCTLRWAQGRIGEVEPAIRLFVEQYPHSAWTPALLIASLAVGRVDEARALFDRLAAADFADVPRDGNWLTTLCLLSIPCTALGDVARAGHLYDLLAPYAARIVVANAAAVCYGSVAPFLGLLADTIGRPADANEHFERGLLDNLGLGHRPQAAWALLRHAQSKHAAGEIADARDMAAEARHWATEIGMAGVAGAAEELLADAPAKTPGQRTRRLAREGDYWTIEFDTAVARVRDGKGIRYLAQLLANPGQRIAALDLVASGGTRSMTVHDMEAMSLDDAGGRQPILDAQAKRAYTERLHDLHSDLDEATAFNDLERVAALEAEKDALVEQLRSAVGLGGRARAVTGPGERARVSVTKVIRQTVRRLAEQDVELGRHLTSTVRTGTFCAYLPDPGAEITWTVVGGSQPFRE